MSDKVYDMMESYLPKDIPSIQKQYASQLFVGLWTMSNILWREQDLISKQITVIRQLHTQFETDLLNTSTTQIVVWTTRVKKKCIIYPYNF